jgi:hypothetical protein
MLFRELLTDPKQVIAGSGQASLFRSRSALLQHNKGDSMSTEADPKFTPPAAALQTVGLTAAQLKNSDAVFDLIVRTQVDIDAHENQISVLIATLTMRGFTVKTMITRTGYSERTLVRKNIEGIAILRTHEVTRTTSAIRSVSMSNKVMEEATRGGSKTEKIDALELAAIDRALASGFTYKDGKPITDESAAVILLATQEAVLNDALPAMAANYIAYIPIMSEQFGIKAKPKQQRNPGDPDGGVNSAMALDYHLKKALADVRSIAEAAEAAYVPTPQDYHALIALCDYLNIPLLLEDEVIETIDALML